MKSVNIISSKIHKSNKVTVIVDLLILKSINMKKIVFCLMAACLSMTFLPLQSSAATVAEPSSLVEPTPAESAEAKTLLLR